MTNLDLSEFVEVTIQSSLVLQIESSPNKIASIKETRVLYAGETLLCRVHEALHSQIKVPIYREKSDSLQSAEYVKLGKVKVV